MIPMEKPIRVAMIGFGLSGRYLQGPFFQNHPDFNLVKILTSQSTEAIPDYQGIPTSSKVEEAWLDDQVDLVAICSPNDTHYALTLSCLQAGKHVLVDKPMAGSLEEIQTLYDEAERQQKVLAVFQNRRFDSDFLTIKDIIQSGKLGKIVRVEVRYDRFKPELNPKKWKEEVRSANGILYDLGAHIIDQMIDLFGEPERVMGRTYQERMGTTIDDAFDILASYSNGPSVLLHSSLLAKEPLPRYVIYGTNGSFLKYGIDVQEDHLKAGVLPTEARYGYEPADQNGYCFTEEGRICVETRRGDWGSLFTSLSQAIQGKGPFVVTRKQMEAQFKVIASIQSNK